MRADRLDDRAQGSGPRRDCSPTQEEATRAVQRLFDERALADPGLTRDQDEPSAPSSRRCGHIPQLGELALATDETMRRHAG